MGGSKRRSRRQLLRDGLTVAAGAALLPALGCPTDDPCDPVGGGDDDDDSAGDDCTPVAGEIANEELERTVIRVHDTRVTDYDYSDPVASPSHSRIGGHGSLVRRVGRRQRGARRGGG